VKETYGVGLPGQRLDDLVGKLIVIEGTDGVGRSTQITLLKEWLEQQGHAVLDTGLTRSGLVGRSIRRAKEGHTLGRITLSLFYTTDFADRLENQIVPALRAGFVVLTDRYIYSLMARAMVRGLDPAWVRNIHRFALKPDAVFYLRAGLEDLIPRAVFSRGFDYWESGMDLYSTEDMYDSFRRYQTALLEQFEQLADEFQFQVIDARPEPRAIFEQLREGILRVLIARNDDQTEKERPERMKTAQPNTAEAAFAATASEAEVARLEVVPKPVIETESERIAQRTTERALERRKKV
jgi:dTMP kinase